MNANFWFAVLLVAVVTFVIVMVLIFYKPPRVTIENCRDPHVLVHGQSVEVSCR